MDIFKFLLHSAKLKHTEYKMEFLFLKSLKSSGYSVNENFLFK